MFRSNLLICFLAVPELCYFIYFQQLWEIRENIPVAIPKLGYTLKYDVSLPLKYFYSVVPEIQNRIGSEGHAFGYGHVGLYFCDINYFLIRHRFSEWDGICFSKLDINAFC